MKNYMRIITLLLCLLLLCSCSTQPSVPESPAATTPEESPTRADDLSAFPDFDAADSTFVLLECKDFRLDLLDVLLPDGTVCLALRVTPYRPDEFYIHFDDVRFNGTYLLEDHIVMSPEDGIPEVRPLMSGVAFGGVVPTELSMVFSAKLDGQEQTQEIHWSAPEGFVPHLICEPYFDARADAQILADNERVKITLVCLGNVWQNLYCENNLGGFLQIENKTDGEIPVKVSGISINGATADIYTDGMELPAGVQVLVPFTISEYQLKDLGIDSISDVSLQIMTDICENTGSSYEGFFEGGSWYPVTLSQAGIAGSPEPGRVVYEDDNLQISILSFENDGGTYKLEGGTHWVWKLMIVNKSDRDLFLHSENEQASNDALPPILSLYDSVGANTYMLAETYADSPAGAPLPEVSFSLGVYTQGQGTLLYSVDEPIVLTPEP